MKNKYFKYIQIDEQKLKELIEIEPKLSKYLDSNQPFYFRVMPDHFHCFVHTVISQQLSNAVVDTIWTKLTQKFKKICPKAFANASLDQLREIGFSENKIKCLKQISYDILDKKISFRKMEKTPDNEIYDILCKYHNVGRWTVDMLLTFSFYRNNIISYNDFGIRKGLKILYSLSEIDSNFLEKINKKFNKKLTLFALVLWKISNEN